MDEDLEQTCTRGEILYLTGGLKYNPGILPTFSKAFQVLERKPRFFQNPITVIRETRVAEAWLRRAMQGEEPQA